MVEGFCSLANLTFVDKVLHQLLEARPVEHTSDSDMGAMNDRVTTCQSTMILSEDKELQSRLFRNHCLAFV